ncbi:hypothetical protein HMPREF1991_00877 [Hoylesella loescheii DSM 19665 = JCM 12249 = ATCC 15930]|uniref:Uncharacterized protein n=1 Tax=Hoylesella loescheii DSM 19665 = JCM 12249 = ATCC 15930 TaxID=1122985 RepID=A0A069QK32_HOYLO|nr:hypothetical protein HMPREF1991_00877 [Hoylesella loescheii DSM 19665 = JCM 12249 = ATCC 15930]
MYNNDKCAYTRPVHNKQVYNAHIIYFLLQCPNCLELSKRHAIPSFSSPL